MSGWLHTHTLADAVPVPVAPTSTTLGGPWSVEASTGLSGYLKNTDGAQSLTVWLETSWDGVGDWVRSAALDSQLSPELVAGDVRPFELDVTSVRHVRLRAQASGAGLTATVSAQSIWQLPVR